MLESAHVTALNIYPVKGCRGIALEKSPIGPRGLAYDREWMVVDSDGRFISQRGHPRLSHVDVSMGDDGLGLSVQGDDEVTVALDQVGERMTVGIWRSELEAVRQGPEADAFFSDMLGAKLHLVRFAPDAVRACNPVYAQDGDHTAFSDGYPVLVTSQTSLERLNKVIVGRGGEAVPIARFRPNLVVAGTAADIEDASRSLVIDNAITIDLVKPCDRCLVTTTDQITGERMGKEPLASLATYRQGFLGEDDRQVYFGQNGVPRVRSGEVTVGASVFFVPR